MCNLLDATHCNLPVANLPWTLVIFLVLFLLVVDLHASWRTGLLHLLVCCVATPAAKREGFTSYRTIWGGTPVRRCGGFTQTFLIGLSFVQIIRVEVNGDQRRRHCVYSIRRK